MNELEADFLAKFCTYFGGDIGYKGWTLTHEDGDSIPIKPIMDFLMEAEQSIRADERGKWLKKYREFLLLEGFDTPDYLIDDFISVQGKDS